MGLNALITAAVFLAVDVAASTIPPAIAAQLLNGRGPAILTFNSTTVDIDSLFDDFGVCDNQCVGATPCGSTSPFTIGGACSATATSNVGAQICLHGTVCCNPSLCRTRVQDQCTYGVSEVVAALGNLNYRSALNLLDFLGGSTAAEAAAAQAVLNVTVPSANNQRCVSQCNGWMDTWSCPSSCQCSPVQVPALVAGTKYRCVSSNGFIASPQSTLPNGTVVCPDGYACGDVPPTTTTTTTCIAPNPNGGAAGLHGPSAIVYPAAPSQQGSGLSKAAIIAIGVSSGVVVLLGLAAAWYFLHKKKQDAVNPTDNDHYTAMHARDLDAKLQAPHWTL
ncbi:Aste57867_13797 [Aphanomyces stellatus]|uniref:Aste57867_13797 protein n=1 Tax=Aphanomyces stellatus TaxID=120398 RepID=A0A485KZY7_9STRA|nr:hypothetical protein As57867_013747 [Aphanomyces stellatus]VFT90629.1 Aste57867_13797 [Aphanomyces stellatus]